MQNVMNLRSVTCEGRIYELKKTSLTEPRGELILIGGSAGSTEALPIILSGFEKDMPPAAVTLHMPYGYTEIYARRLNEAVPIDVVEAENGMRLRNGMAAIAQGAKHLRVMKDGLGYYLSVSEGERVSGHCPSVDVLFESAAALKAKEMIAVILTGMGSDGAKGLLQLRRAGAYTIGQDEKSSLVYGMPKSAFEMGAVEKQCGLNKISQEIKRRLKEMIK
jgi:two-component system chemotaxis response regulator CheB